MVTSPDMKLQLYLRYRTLYVITMLPISLLTKRVFVVLFAQRHCNQLSVLSKHIFLKYVAERF